MANYWPSRYVGINHSNLPTTWRAPENDTYGQQLWRGPSLPGSTHWWLPQRKASENPDGGKHTTSWLPEWFLVLGRPRRRRHHHLSCLYTSRVKYQRIWPLQLIKYFAEWPVVVGVHQYQMRWLYQHAKLLRRDFLEQGKPLYDMNIFVIERIYDLQETPWRIGFNGYRRGAVSKKTWLGTAVTYFDPLSSTSPKAIDSLIFTSMLSTMVAPVFDSMKQSHPSTIAYHWGRTWLRSEQGNVIMKWKQCRCTREQYAEVVLWHLYLSSVTTWLGLVMWLSVAPFPMVITNEVLTPFASTTT